MKKKMTINTNSRIKTIYAGILRNVMGKFIVILTVLPGLLSCGPGVHVQSLGEIKEVDKNAVVYALPKTVIHVEVKAEKITTKKGPFYLFADRLLDEDNVVATDKIQWRLKDIRITSRAVPDTSGYYVVEARKPHVLQRLNLREDGILTGLNTGQGIRTRRKPTQSFLQKQDTATLAYRKLTTEKNLKENVDTVYHGGGIDTLFLRIPSLKRQIVEKSTGEKAKAAADFIFELRRKRYNLLFGEGKDIHDGKALETMLQEQSKYEEQFTSLFTGIKYAQTYTREFRFVPSEGGELAQHLLFRFSETRGILPSDSRIGTPVYLDSRNSENTARLQKFNDMHTVALKDPAGLIYRIPEKAEIKLFKDRKVIAKRSLNVAQYGETMRLPASLVNDESVIRFYPETGGLKSIQKMPAKD